MTDAEIDAVVADIDTLAALVGRLCAAGYDYEQILAMTRVAVEKWEMEWEASAAGPVSATPDNLA